MFWAHLTLTDSCKDLSHFMDKKYTTALIVRGKIYTINPQTYLFRCSVFRSSLEPLHKPMLMKVEAKLNSKPIVYPWWEQSVGMSALKV